MRETQVSRMWEKNEDIRKGSKWTMTTPKSNDFIPTHLSLVDLRSQYTLWRLGFLWLSFLNIKSQWTWFTNTSFPSFGMLLWGNCCRCVCELTYQCGSVKSTTKKDRFFNFTLKKLLSYLKISLLLFSQVWIFHKSWELTQTFSCIISSCLSQRPEKTEAQKNASFNLHRETLGRSGLRV